MNMNHMIKELFGPIQAEEELKNRTKAFLATKTQGYTRRRTINRTYPLYAAVCACCFFMLFGGHWLYFTPAAQISIDINPSIEMSINRFGRVVAVNEFNGDGRELSAALDIKYRSYTDAIRQILDNDTIAELLSDNEIMTITVIGRDRRQSAEILSDVEACTAKQNNTYCFFASSEEVAQAHETGLSCGKYRAFLELESLDPDITCETVKGMTMREIRDLINSLSTSGEDHLSSYNNRGNGHHGHSGGHGRGWRNGR